MTYDGFREIVEVVGVSSMLVYIGFEVDHLRTKMHTMQTEIAVKVKADLDDWLLSRFGDDRQGTAHRYVPPEAQTAEQLPLGPIETEETFKPHWVDFERCSIHGIGWSNSCKECESISKRSFHDR